MGGFGGGVAGETAFKKVRSDGIAAEHLRAVPLNREYVHR